MKTIRMVAGLALVLGLLTAIFAGMPWYISQDPILPLWLKIAVYAVLGVYLGLCFIAGRERSSLWPEIVGTVVSGAVAAPVMIYDYYVFTFNPALHAWSVQNLTPSPPPWDYVLGYGLILALVLLAML